MQKRISGKINTIIEFFSANKLFVALFILLLALSAVTCFYALGRLPVNSWDEARHGVNAYEMMRTGNYISNTYNYVTDYWNLKPPMSFWAIILGFKLFGTGVMGLRFYSAVSMLLIILICAIFIYKQSGRLACIITTGLLATYPIFYVFHFARAGDSDALFALFLTTGTLSLYYLNKNIRFLYVNGICFALAFLTKSWHALLIPAICIFYLFLCGDYKRVKMKNLLVYLLCALAPVFAWAAFRYSYDGMSFFIRMFTHDLLARSSQVVERHEGGIFYYFYFIFNNWVGMLFIAASVYFVIMLALKKKAAAFLKKIKTFRLAILLTLWVLIPLVIYSISKTKIEWYIFPELIPFIIIVSVMCSGVINKAPVKMIRYGFAALTIFVFTASCWANIGQLTAEKQNGLQSFIVNDVAKSSAVKSHNVYMLLNGGIWTQDDTFLSEAYADLRCKNGGIAPFLHSRNSVAIDSLTDYDKHFAIFKNIRVISQNKAYVLILNK